MLSRVEIKNYRGFQTFRADGLARVNLFVGKNNSGKTALLEGLQFLTSRGDPSVLVEIADRRGEVIINRLEPGSRLVDIAHLFHGHTYGPDTTITIQGDNGYSPAVLKVFPVNTEPTKQRSPPPGLALKIATSEAVKAERDDPRLFPISRDGGVDLEIPRRYRGNTGRRGGPQVRFVGPESLTTVEMAVMWDEITLTGQEVDVAGTLRILDSNLESLHFLMGMMAGGYFPSRGGIVAGVKGEGRVPLGSMGDGMRRLMAISTALAFTKQGCLFVDEIDTGLHYSIMADMWKLIVSKAVASDTQVFATTHSWDCIEGLSNLLTNNPHLASEVAIHKIDRQIPHSIQFSGSSITGMIKSHIDPR